MHPVHPLIRHAVELICGIAALGTCIVSFSINPGSALWLIGIYATVVAGLAALRRIRGTSTLHLSLLGYLLTLNQYFFIVWVLSIWLPGPDPAKDQEQVMFWTRWLCIGSILNPIAHYHFTLRFSGIRHWLLLAIEWLGWACAVFFIYKDFSGELVISYQWTGHGWIPIMSGYYSWFFKTTTFYLSFSLCVLLVRVFAMPKTKNRLQLHYYLLGAMPFHLACWCNFLISLGMKLPRFAGWAFLFHVIVLAYAVFSHRLFDISIAVRRGLAYAAVSL